MDFSQQCTSKTHAALRKEGSTQLTTDRLKVLSKIVVVPAYRIKRRQIYQMKSLLSIICRLIYHHQRHAWTVNPAIAMHECRHPPQTKDVRRYRAEYITPRLQIHEPLLVPASPLQAFITFALSACCRSIDIVQWVPVLRNRYL
jgi:hypothetical protein